MKRKTKILDKSTDLWDAKSQTLIKNWEIWINFRRVSKNNIVAIIRWYYYDADKNKKIGSCIARGTTVENTFIILEERLLDHFTE